MTKFNLVEHHPEVTEPTHRKWTSSAVSGSGRNHTIARPSERTITVGRRCWGGPLTSPPRSISGRARHGTASVG